MAEPATILIPADNRLLGWGMSDLTLYGNQPAAGMVIGRAADPAAGIDPAAFAAAATTAGSPPGQPSEADTAASETTALLDEPVNQPAATPAPVAPVLPTPGEGIVSHGAGQPSVAPPIGSGSFVDAPAATPLQTVADQAAASEGSQAPGAVATTLAPVAPVIAPAIADAVGTAEALTGTITQSLADTVGTAEALTGALAQPLADTAGAADALAGTVTQTLADTVGTVQTLVADAGALTDIPSLLDSVTDGDAVIDTIPLSSFAGTDPMGGITTLVSMVESSEAFDHGHAVTPLADLSSGSILDSLADDAAPSGLLGDDHAGDGHILDDHGTHLGI